MSNWSDVQGKIDEAVTLQEAGDYAGAIVKLRSAQMLMAGLPSASQHAEERVERPTHQGIQNMIEQLQVASNAQATGGGFQQVPVEYVRECS